MTIAITDDMACEITALASNTGTLDDHAVIDRIDGIRIGIMGKHNEYQTIHITSNSTAEVIIHRYDLTEVRKIRRIFNKGIIKKKLSDIGIENVTYNPH